MLSEDEQLYEAIAEAIGRPAWMADGNCVGLDPERFFPGRGASTRPARAVCHGCPVREECLEFAMATGEKEGVWGGRSERERRRLRTKRPMAPRRCPFAPCAGWSSSPRRRRSVTARRSTPLPLCPSASGSLPGEPLYPLPLWHRE